MHPKGISSLRSGQWHEEYKDFLAEKTINPDTLKESFTHQKLVSAYKSLRTNLLYLFTYKNHKEYKIHNTTNAIVPQGHKKWWSVLPNEKTAKNTQWIY